MPARDDAEVGAPVEVVPVLVGYRDVVRRTARLTVVAVVGAAVGAASARPRTARQPPPPPSPSALPVPVLWPEPGPDQRPAAFRGRADERPLQQSREGYLASWAAVGLVVLGLVGIAFAVVLQSVGLAVLGGVPTAVGVLLAVRSRIMEEATVGQSPSAPPP